MIIKSMEKEVWKDVVGYEKYYQVSSYGKIFSKQREVTHKTKYGSRTYFKKAKILKNTIGNNGYRFVELRGNQIIHKTTVHRVVCSNFLENPNNYPCVNHIDGNKLNNHVSNLEWCTYSHNIQHAIDNKLRVVEYGSKNHKSKLKDNHIKEIFNLYEKGISAINIAHKFKVSGNTISKLLRGKTRIKNLVDLKLNTTDFIIKNRKLSNEQVIKIRQLYKLKELSNSEIINIYKITESTYYDVVKYRTYKDLI